MNRSAWVASRYPEGSADACFHATGSRIIPHSLRVGWFGLDSHSCICVASLNSQEMNERMLALKSATTVATASQSSLELFQGSMSWQLLAIRLAVGAMFALILLWTTASLWFPFFVGSSHSCFRGGRGSARRHAVSRWIRYEGSPCLLRIRGGADLIRPPFLEHPPA